MIIVEMNIPGFRLHRLARSPESWLAMQYNYDLWQARRRVDLGSVRKVRLIAA